MPLLTLIVLICHYQFRLVSPIRGYLFSPHIVTSVPSLFMFACMQELMFYDECSGLYVFLGDFAAGLGAGNDEH